ncbi:FeoB small GTPase domain-containing protein [Neobacillus niacini]|uniref:FeoB small GTPase domain-containing protein n=1 Tax=Neobacillus niacini TaxID=86668 RepID=UPI0021CB75D2|nr:FeoB small GTPase domain-containing protein [Neobacillus niacini]MCM3766428.1 50S ribosome-binding GTPase [Neobacillus niacini]
MNVKKIALAGNPNTGKSTLFNTLTGLKQHTGNWPGKTVVHAEGNVQYQGQEYLLIDLPGTYSLFSNSTDEEVARDYIVFEQPDATLVVVDGTSMERNLNLALQVLEMTDKVIICINLIDEAEKKGIVIDEGKLSSKLGVPVVKISARNKQGIDTLLDTIARLLRGDIQTKPYRMTYQPEIEEQIKKLESRVRELIGHDYPSRWMALRLLDGDDALLKKLHEQIQMKGREVKSYEFGNAINS